MTPYPFQQAAIDLGSQFLAAAEPGSRLLVASPTGTGKTVMELAVQARFPDAWIVTPRVEIVAGMLEKLGVDVAGLSSNKLVEVAFDRRITTPIRFRNLMLGGFLVAPGKLILDECHHDTSTTYEQLDALTGQAPCLGFTATPFRGTPKGTAWFRELWGSPVWAISTAEAAEQRYLSVPSCSVIPLCDDDTIEVVNGEFQANVINRVVGDRLADAARLAAAWFSGGRFDRPTMASLPSVETATRFMSELCHLGLPGSLITASTGSADRRAAFDRCVASEAILVQINVVSEGVDLPIRRLLDLSPTLSPVKWLQQLGRVTRPVKSGEAAPEYVCTNRNLLRHGYLLEGCLPPAVLAQAQQAFGGLGKRAGLRVVGLEALGRLQAVEFPMAGGLKGLCYNVSSVAGHQVTEYCVLLHPARSTPVWARRNNVRVAEGEYRFGRWSRCEPPDQLTGFASVPPRPLTEKQAAWWKRDAARFGLEPTAKVTKKSFAVLPVLADLKVRI